MSSVKGIEQLLSRLDQVRKDFEQEVKDIISINIGDMENEAIRLAPGPSDEIKTQFGTQNERDIVNGRNWTPISQAITSEIYPDGFGGRVMVDNSAGDIAAWVEFGTGQSAATYLATVPPEWRAVAAKYIRNKRGTIVNQPFLFPSYEKYSLQTIKELKQAAKDIKI